MGKYTCEGLGTIPGGNYDELTIEGVFSAKNEITANTLVCEGVINFSDSVRADSLHMEGVINTKGYLYAGNMHMEGVLNANQIMVAGNISADGCICTNSLTADNAVLYYDSSKDTPKPFACVRSLLFGHKISNNHSASIGEIQTGTLEITDYNVHYISGNDIIIGPNCVVDTVSADKRLRIHRSATVDTITGAATPEYYD